MISDLFHPIRTLLQPSGWRVVVAGAVAMAALLVGWLVVMRLIVPAGRRSVQSYATFRPIRHAGPSFKLRVYDNQQRVVAEFEAPHPVGKRE